MRAPVVVDTNVAVVASGGTPHAGPGCVRACARRLRAIQRDGTVLLDESGLILLEYRRNLQSSEALRVGQRFFRWIAMNLGNPDICRRVPITPHADRGFAEFPDDEELGGFDDDDRKFVAVAIAGGDRPPIINASDTDWHHYREPLARHRVQVEFVCPELMPAREAG